MENNNINTEPKDAFSELIRQKLESHTMPIDPNGWDQIQSRMQPKRKKAFLWWTIIGSAAVLALLINVIQLGKFQTNQEFTQVTRTEIQESTTNSEIEIPESGINSENTIKQTEFAPKRDISDQEKLQKNPAAKVAKQNIAITNSPKNDKISKTEFANKVIETEENIQTSNAIIVESNKSAKDSIEKSNDKKNIPRLNELPKKNEAETPDYKPKTKDTWLIAAAFGTGGSASFGGNYDMLMTEGGDMSLTNAVTEYTNILAPDDFSQKTFMAPLSFGLVVRRDLGSKLAIETGLVYTYLYSSFEENGNLHSDAQLKLHYLGIPLNIVVPLWKSSNWETYISAGPMVEKGLRSMYVQHQYFGNQIFTTSANTKIDGLQWSVNTAVGFTYKIQRNIGLYFEPKFSYYFDNDQPISARTDQPLVIGLTAGVKFKF